MNVELCDQCENRIWTTEHWQLKKPPFAFSFCSDACLYAWVRIQRDAEVDEALQTAVAQQEATK